MLLGPNTGLGHSSMVYMAESQIGYAIDALRETRKRGAQVFEVKPEVVERYNRAIDQRMGDTVWSTGCKSWYLDDTGRNSTLWPDFTFLFRRRASRFDPAEYRLDTSAPRPEPAAA
jgi:hypothetical protein